MSNRMEALICVLILIVSWGAYFCYAESGFLSLDCGGSGNRTDPNTGITWTPDDKFIHAGYREDRIDPNGLEFYQQSLRVFPKPLNKSCYNLPITPNVPFLLRLYFVGMDYTNKIPDFKYSIETKDMLSLRNATPQLETPQASEKILVSGGQTLYICLIRGSADVDPFISSIELRPLRQGMYAPHVSPGLMLDFLMRQNFGASELVRYPQDKFDRTWEPKTVDGADNVTSVETISTNDTRDLPPPLVMQTAVSTVNTTFDFQFEQVKGKNLLLLYFAEIMNLSGSRIFDIFVNEAKIVSDLGLVRNNSAIELPLMDTAIYLMTLSKASNSAMGPMLNALELYQLVISSTPTSSEDVEALATFKKLLTLSNWISDPCFGHPWEGIVCTDSSVPVRVSEINLSNRNLTGSIPSSLGNMTALIKISLNSNHLTGGLPDLSKLGKLESLHLQNNNLSGEVPAWLSQLPNLKELFIQNNNFSGLIPPKLLHTTSLSTRCDGNVHISKKNGECQRPSSATPSSHSNGRNVGIISGVIAGAISIAGLVLLVGIITSRKKSSTKESVNSGSKGNSESIYVRGQDFSMVLVPNSTKTRSFTLDEMLTATENFNHKIGKGGFGSVFLGKLGEGKQIAVKVLSSFSKQGAIEFLNEIDLLSRVHHKNLVSLLGYCNESRELMLAYEYMLGGSLKDYLYGPKAGDNAKLDWKIRLKIALDAAYGLEYLHVGCTPKIIHRDVKTANILLDANLNGKLADFGLSRVTIDGEESHVTTTVKGTAGYLDPEYFSTQMLTEKSDVYSFGVVLLEIICGRKPIDGKLSEEEINLVRWVTPYAYLEEDPIKISNIVDKRLQPHDYNIKSINHLVKLGIRCTVANPLARPTVSDVVAEIKLAMRYEKENNVGDDSDMLLFSEDYNDQMSSQVSNFESSGPKEMASSENNSSFYD